MKKVTQTQAQKVVDQLQESFNKVIDGKRFYPDPILNMDWDGRVAILWEDGPDDWCHHMDGSPSESDYEMFEDANREFGGNLKPPTRKEIKFPTDVWGEPYYSFVLCLYREA